MADILTIDANKLEQLSSPKEGQSVIMVNQATNKGLQIDYEQLADAILSKVLTKNVMPVDGFKLVIVNE